MVEMPTYALHTSELTFDLRDGSMQVHYSITEPWMVTLVDTGVATMTGGRLKRVLGYLGDQDFCFTYGDGLTDLRALVPFHRERDAWRQSPRCSRPDALGRSNSMMW